MPVVAQTGIRNAIIDLRHVMGLTQAAFGRQVGISLTSVGHFESGSRVPEPGLLIRLASTALQAQREDLAEIFVSGLPGVPEGLLKPTWDEFVDPKAYPKCMYHPVRPMVIVRSPREERALGPEWSRKPS
jgi:transcriptional regulator with XRE-family HTH domain